MKRTKRIAWAFLEKFRKKELPKGWLEQPAVKSGKGFDKLLRQQKETKPEQPKKYKRKRIKLSEIAIRRIYGKYKT